MNITLNVNFGLSEDLKALLLQGVAALAAERSSDPSSDAAPAEPKSEPAKRPRKTAAEKAQPTPPADPAPEAAAQDAADEAAEQQEKAPEPAAADAKVVTRDDLRGVGGEYARLYGMPAGLEDGPKIIGCPSFGKVPDDGIAAAHAAMMSAIAQNPYGREKVA